MSTIFRLRKNDENAGSGGKIMRGRRVPDVRSPYARPTPSNSSVVESPNRLLGLISPASRIITGAAKMISTVFFPDSPQTSSSSDDESDDDDIASQGDGATNQNGATSESNTHAEDNLLLNIPKNEIKLAIEHLITQETFSRVECNKLVKIIESRVVDFPVSDREIGDTCNSAIMEAKKWLEEKRMESHSQFDKDQGAFSSNPHVLSNVTVGEQGSPVLMAKSYMKSRPPWASPTIGQIGFKTTSPIGLSMEEAHALSSSKDLKRNSLAMDSMNSLAMDSMTDGSKRVRFKSADHTVQPITLHDDSHKDVQGEEINVTQPSSGDPRDPTQEGAQITVAEGTTHFVDNLLPETHDGPSDQSIVNAELRCTTSDVKPAIQSDSNDLPRVNGTDGLVMEASQRHQHFGGNETNSFDESREDDGKNREVIANGSRVNTMEGSCELLSEASIEVPSNPSNEEISNIASGSLNSSSRQGKETQSISSPGAKKRVSARGADKEKEKPPPPVVVKKVGRYARRGRGRGKLT